MISPESRNSPPDFASITVQIPTDGMSAKLVIVPNEGKQGILTIEHLQNELARNGIIHGIDENALNSVVQKWNSNPKFLETAPVAKGSKPEPGREGELHYRVKHLTNPNEIEQVKHSAFFFEIPQLASRLQRVDPGTIVAEYGAGHPSNPGKNVFGELLFIEEAQSDREHTLGEGIALSSDRKKLTSTKTGVVCILNGHPTVIPLNFNGMVEIQVSPDHMKAELVIRPAGEKGSMPSEQEIRSLLKQQQITKGICEDNLKQLLNRFAQNRSQSEVVLIAQGQAPVKGSDGRVELLFEAVSSLKPTINAEGSADYKNVNIIHPVSEGTKLAKLHPPTEGTAGFDVTGKVLPAQNGTEVKLPTGANTIIAPNEPSFLISTTEGIVRFNGITVDVFEGYIISGDVDFSTGNVTYDKSVVVNGDIKSGFSVQCGGDLQVGGVIEDCQIHVNGNLLCKFGYIGQGKGILEVKGDVNLGFMKNQTLRCRGSVHIAKEAINCTILSRKSIQVHGNPLSVAGGTLTANESITVQTAGNASGIRTTLEMGPDFTLMEELLKTENQILELRENIAKLQKILENDTGHHQPNDLLKKIKQKLVTIEQQISILEERKKVLTAKTANFDHAVIKIERSALPGTVLKIGQRYLLVKEEIIGPKTVRLIDHELKIL